MELLKIQGVGSTSVDIIVAEREHCSIASYCKDLDWEAKSRYESYMQDDYAENLKLQERAIPMKLDPPFNPLPFYYAIVQSHTVLT
jgi:hypothetical protein